MSTAATTLYINQAAAARCSSYYLFCVVTTMKICCHDTANPITTVLDYAHYFAPSPLVILIFLQLLLLMLLPQEWPVAALSTASLETLCESGSRNFHHKVQGQQS